MSTFVSVDEASKHESRHVLRLGEAQRAADEALDPGLQMAVCARDLLRVLLAHLRLLGIIGFHMGTVPLDIPCGGLLLTESERGSCLALPRCHTDQVMKCNKTKGHICNTISAHGEF